MDLTSKNHNHNSFDQRLKWIQLPKITTLWSETQMDPTSQNHNTLIRDPNGSNFPKSQHFWSETQMDPTSQNHNTLIRDPNGSNFPKSQHFDQRPKYIQLPENLPRKQHFDERERGGPKKKTEPEFDQVQGSGWDPQSVFYFILFRRSHLIGALQIFLEHEGASPT